MHTPIPPGSTWAKLSPRGRQPEQWHPLADHCADVASCLEALLSIPIIRQRLATLSGVPSFPELWKSRLAVIAFLHDFGKANSGFQACAAGHIAEAAYILDRLALKQSCGLDVLDTWTPDGAVGPLTVSIAHHGAPPDFDCLPQCDQAWLATEINDPQAVVRSLVSEARRQWPDAFNSGGEQLPSNTSPFWHGFLGLIQLADWLGSDNERDAFPYSEVGDVPRFDYARRRASMLVQQIGFNQEKLRNTLPPVINFSNICDFKPSPIQISAADAPGPVVVLEAETGSGKTEAALWRFAKLFQEGRVDGLYFALPTRIAASQIHRRVQGVMKRLFGSAAPEVLRAVPGDVRMDEAVARPLPNFVTQWNDDPSDAGKRARWAAEQPKRFLAAPVAVGTIDQALLGAVCVKHAQMRSICLSRSLLVVDEVHASDAYMESLLIGLLEQHKRAGGEALLLSATLGATSRVRLLTTRRRTKTPSLEESIVQSYPALSWIAGKETHISAVPSQANTKTVEVLSDINIADYDAVAKIALDVARTGARVLVIRNTVKDAIRTLRALEMNISDGSYLFRLDGITALHHGRFAREDRVRLDAEVERVLGKGSPSGPLVLVGTQTLEQSLDIDADYMITDLAPMDVLLQRIGRLHRHMREERPVGFTKAQVRVLVPSDFSAVLSARNFVGPHGHGSVYENLLSLAATKELIDAATTWVLPKMNRELVERATHPEALEALKRRLADTDDRWIRAGEKYMGLVFAQGAAARLAAIDWLKPAAEYRLAEDRVGTRLGLKDLEIEFDTPLRGPFSGSRGIKRLILSQHLVPEVVVDLKPVEISQLKLGFSFRMGEAVLNYTNHGIERVSGEAICTTF